MSIPNHNLNPTLSSALRIVYKRFQEDTRDIIQPHGLLLQQDGLNFLGVDTSLRTSFDACGFRCSIAALLHLKSFRTVQVVGDCGIGFTSTGCQRAREVISSVVVQGNGLVRDDIVLEYGYTASKYDTNWIVNDIIDTMPKLSAQTIGNLVHMSSVAVENWGCEATGNVCNFVLAYDREGETAFGSDIWLSDSILSSLTGDTLICLEGGPQAFAQAVNAILQGAMVILVTGPGMRMQAAQNNFSAACMLGLMHDRLQTCDNKERVTPMERETIQSQAMKYLEHSENLKSPPSQSRYDLIEQALIRLMARPESLNVLQIVHVR